MYRWCINNAAVLVNYREEPRGGNGALPLVGDSEIWVTWSRVFHKSSDCHGVLLPGAGVTVTMVTKLETPPRGRVSRTDKKNSTLTQQL